MLEKVITLLSLDGTYLLRSMCGRVDQTSNVCSINQCAITSRFCSEVAYEITYQV